MADSDLELQLRVFKIDRIASYTTIRFGSAVAIAAFAWLCVRAF